MSETLKFRVTLEVEFQVTPGQYQSADQFEDDGETYKTLYKLSDIADDMVKGLQDDYDEVMYNNDGYEVVKVELIP